MWGDHGDEYSRKVIRSYLCYHGTIILRDRSGGFASIYPIAAIHRRGSTGPRDREFIQNFRSFYDGGKFIFYHMQGNFNVKKLTNLNLPRFDESKVDETLDFISASKIHHVYTVIWENPIAGEELKCQCNVGTSHDPLTVAVIKQIDTIVGHVFERISASCNAFIHRGV